MNDERTGYVAITERRMNCLFRFMSVQCPSSVGIYLHNMPVSRYDNVESAMLADVIYKNDMCAWEILCDKLEDRGLQRPVFLGTPVTGWQFYQFLWRHHTRHIFWCNADLVKGGKYTIRRILKNVSEDDNIVSWNTMRTMQKNSQTSKSFKFIGSIAVVVNKKLDTQNYYWGDFPRLLC